MMRNFSAGLFAIASRWLVIFGLIGSAWPQLYAQSPCLAFEQELKGLFYNYQMTTQPNMDRVESAWSGCRTTTPVMGLAYNYLKAVDALYDPSQGSKAAYMEAAYYYYDRCGEYFPYLQDPKAQDQTFVNRFIDRANELEKTLLQQERRLGIQPQARQPQPNDQTDLAGNWLKTQVTSDYELSLEDRSQGRREASTESNEFDKRVRSPESNLSSLWPDVQPTYDEGKSEPYGYVGTVRTVSPMEYLRWRGQYRDVGAPDNSQVKQGTFRSNPVVPPAGTAVYQTMDGRVIPRAELPVAAPFTTRHMEHGTNRGNGMQPRNYENNQDPTTTPMPGNPEAMVEGSLGVATPSTQTTRGLPSASPASNPMRQDPARQLSSGVNPTGATYNLKPATNVMDPLAVRSRPGGREGTSQFVHFGEEVLIRTDVKKVVANSIPFIMIQTPEGRVGWVEESALVSSGRLGVVTQPLQGYASPDGGSAAHLFKPGDMLVRSDVRNGWNFVSSKNGEQEVWVSGSLDGKVSTNPRDIQIADAYHEAKMIADHHVQYQHLLGIRKIPGYAQSPLRSVVEEFIRITGK